MPDIFFYFDYMPRVELLTNPDYLDKYYEPLNARWREFQDNSEYKPFISRNTYMRASVTQSGFVYLVPPSDKSIGEISELAHWMFDGFLKNVDEADATPDSERAALAERDLLIRRTVAERDPANIVGEQLFGKEHADKLVARSLGWRSVISETSIIYRQERQARRSFYKLFFAALAGFAVQDFEYDPSILSFCKS